MNPLALLGMTAPLFCRRYSPDKMLRGRECYPPMADAEAEKWKSDFNNDPDLLYEISPMGLDYLEADFVRLTEGGWVFAGDSKICFRSRLHRMAFDRFCATSYFDGEILRFDIVEWHPSDIDFVQLHGLGYLHGGPNFGLHLTSDRAKVFFQTYLISAERAENVRCESLIPIDAPPGMPIPRGRWELPPTATRPALQIEVAGAGFAGDFAHVVYRPIGQPRLESIPFSTWQTIGVKPIAPEPEIEYGSFIHHSAE